MPLQQTSFCRTLGAACGAMVLVAGMAACSTTKSQTPASEEAPAREDAHGGGESTTDTLKICGLYSASDAFLGVGLIAVISNPIVPFISLGYAGGSYALCYYARKYDRPDAVDMEAIVTKASDNTEEKLKHTFIKASEKINERSDEVDRSFHNVEKKLQEAGDRARENVEKAGAKVIQQIYEEIEVLKNSEFEIHEGAKEEYIPHRSPPALRLDD